MNATTALTTQKSGCNATSFASKLALDSFAQRKQARVWLRNFFIKPCIMQGQNKHASDEGALRFSQRVASKRKDVECTVIKKILCIPKHMLIHSTARIDNVFLHCFNLCKFAQHHDTVELR